MKINKDFKFRIYPKFKSKRNNIKSYTTKNTNNLIGIEGNMLKFPKLGLLKTKFHRQIPQKTKVTKLHYKIKNFELDFLYKLSAQLVNKNNVIPIKDFSIKSMS